MPPSPVSFCPKSMLCLQASWTDVKNLILYLDIALRKLDFLKINNLCCVCVCVACVCLYLPSLKNVMVEKSRTEDP